MGFHKWDQPGKKIPLHLQQLHNGLAIAYRNIAFELMKSGEVIEHFSSVNGLFKSIPVLIISGDKRKHSGVRRYDV